jgi:2-polyprenyl-3-methyl-5-hydroxy-6-metoxy-1,4-benzoquinol methylase
MFSESAFYSVKQIYSSKLLLENALYDYPELGFKSPVVLPQGRCLPPIKKGGIDGGAEERRRIDSVLRPEGSPENLFVVIGLGSIHYRKGVDLFIQCAQRVMKKMGNKPVRFVWFGHGYDVDNDNRYSSYLNEQIIRAGVESMCTITHETDQLDHVYDLANLLFLSSRLDPLPLVSQDMMAHGKPVICFNKATGLADYLVDIPEVESCVVDYMDVEAAASRILQLVDSATEYNKVGQAMKSILENKFDFDLYARKIESECKELISLDKNILEFISKGTKKYCCPICNKTDTVYRFRWDKFLIITCPHCDGDFIFPKPSEEELKKAYDNPAYFGGGELRGGYTDYDEQTNLVMPLFKTILGNLEREIKGRRLLDVGCAYGMHLEVASGLGWKTTGVEISDHARAEAARRLHGKADFYESVSEIPSEQFDVVMLMDVIEHYSDPLKVFYELFNKKIIGPETRVIITTPNVRSETALADQERWKYYHPPYHLSYFSAKTFMEMFKQLGFSKIMISGIHPPSEQDKAGRITCSEGLLAIAWGKIDSH